MVQARDSKCCLAVKKRGTPRAPAAPAKRQNATRQERARPSPRRRAKQPRATLLLTASISIRHGRRRYAALRATRQQRDYIRYNGMRQKQMLYIMAALPSSHGHTPYRAARRRTVPPLGLSPARTPLFTPGTPRQELRAPTP